MTNDINATIRGIAEDLRELVRKDNDAIRLFSDYAEDIVAKLPIVKDLNEEVEILEKENDELLNNIDNLKDHLDDSRNEIKDLEDEAIDLRKQIEEIKNAI